MNRLLQDIAAAFCVVAAWARASGQKEAADQLVNRAVEALAERRQHLADNRTAPTARDGPRT
jgi:hypothetical protein